MAYAVSFKSSAAKAFDKLPKSLQTRVIEKATALAEDRHPPGAIKLTGANNLWRIRIGDYRVVYVIDDHHHTVDIRIIAHRREVYRGL